MDIRRKPCSAADGIIFKLSPYVSYHICVNNCFKPFCLLSHLGVNNIQATGMLNKNYLRKWTIIWDKQLLKETWPLEQRASSKKCSAVLTVVQWLVGTTTGWFK